MTEKEKEEKKEKDWSWSILVVGLSLGPSLILCLLHLCHLLCEWDLCKLEVVLNASISWQDPVGVWCRVSWFVLVHLYISPLLPPLQIKSKFNTGLSGFRPVFYSAAPWSAADPSKLN